MSQKIKPTGDYVALKIDDSEAKTAGGLFIPPKAKSNQRDAELGIVIAVGPGRTTEYGSRMEVDVKVGDKALLARGAGVEVYDVETQTKYRIIRSCELLGTVEESRIITSETTLVLP